MNDKVNRSEPTTEKDFDQWAQQLRPRALRYAVRMVGSLEDAEDVVQESFTRAYSQWFRKDIQNHEAWLMRIVHNKAIDYLRSVHQSSTDPIEETPAEFDEISEFEAEAIRRMAFSLFLELSPLQRSCVVLKDVIGYSLAEISEHLDLSVGAVKAALSRARSNLKSISESDPAISVNSVCARDRELLQNYVEQFAARDFDALRQQLATDVRMSLVGRAVKLGAKDVGEYYSNYDRVSDWSPRSGMVNGKPAVLITSPGDNVVRYFILLQWGENGLRRITDFRYATFILDDAAVKIQCLT